MLESLLMLCKIKEGNNEERAPVHPTIPSKRERRIKVPHQRPIPLSTYMDTIFGWKEV